MPSSEVKVLVIGDSHFKTSSLHLCDLYIAECVNIAIKTKPDFIVLLGDTLDCHNTVYIQCYNKALKFIKELSNIALTIVLIGNHDYIDQSQFLTNNA